MLPGGEEFKDHCGIDVVDSVPYRVENPVRASGRGGRGFGESESDFLDGEGDSRGVPL